MKEHPASDSMMNHWQGVSSLKFVFRGRVILWITINSCTKITSHWGVILTEEQFYR